MKPLFWIKLAVEVFWFDKLPAWVIVNIFIQGFLDSWWIQDPIFPNWKHIFLN